jgi:hypothetical protein
VVIDASFRLRGARIDLIPGAYRYPRWVHNSRLLGRRNTRPVMAASAAAAIFMKQTAADETYLRQHRRSFGFRPIRVLTSGNHGVGHLERKPPDTPEHLKYERETTLAQARWLELSSNAKQIFTHNCSEYVQFDEPETPDQRRPRSV